MSVIKIVTPDGFESASFSSSITTDILDPTTKIKYLKHSIVISGDNGCRVELYGDDLLPEKNHGVVETGAFFIGDEKVAELSDLDVDISSNQWVAGVITSGYAPVSIALGTLSAKGFRQQELTIFGADGDDTISGAGKEQNYLFGGRGDDIFFGGDGSNYFDGGKGYDLVDYVDGAGKKGIVASLVDQSINKGDAKGDAYSGVEDLTGGLNDDLLIGDGKANKLNGHFGSDTLIGGAGKDTLDGGKNDEESFDFVSYEGALSLNDDGHTGVAVSLDGNKGVGAGDAKGDALQNVEGLIGSDFHDLLIGDRNTNTLYGGFGNDTLVGGRGVDILWGDKDEFGAGYADTFLFGSPKDGGDRIMDFDVYDHIGISRKGFGLSDSFAIDLSTLIVGDKPQALYDVPTFLFNTTTNSLLFDADGAGGKSAKLIAEVTFHSQQYLDQNDFALVA